MKKNFMDQIVEFIDLKLVPPLTKFATLRPMQVIRNGMVALMPMIILSSVFLILFMLAQPTEEGGKAILSFLTPYGSQLIMIQNYGLSFLALYASVAFGIAFSDVYNTNKTATAILSLNCFFAINVSVGELTQFTGNFGGAGLFGCMLSSFTAGYTMYICEKKKITINLPKSVPSEILNSFKAIVPFLIAVPLCWFVRTICNIDITNALNSLLRPLFSFADSAFVYGLYCFFMLLFWSVGMHGDNMLGGVVDPLTTLWGTENAAAAAAGVPLTQLPHVWAYSFKFLHIWIGAIWPLAIYLAISKVKTCRVIGRTVSLPTIFICEPIVFGVPIVLNPILFIPMILSGTITGVVAYLIMNAGFISRIFVNVPWTVPHGLFEILCNGGDLKIFIIPIISLILGLIIWYPFFKAYEKQMLLKEQELENQQ